MERTLVENCGIGAAGLRRLMAERFGVDVSEEAIERKCYRLGVSPRLGVSVSDRDTCWECGSHFRRTWSGQTLCQECQARENRDRQLRIRDEIEETERRAKAVNRDYERIRKWNQRHRM